MNSFRRLLLLLLLLKTIRIRPSDLLHLLCSVYLSSIFFLLPKFLIPLVVLARSLADILLVSIRSRWTYQLFAVGVNNNNVRYMISIQLQIYPLDQDFKIKIGSDVKRVKGNTIFQREYWSTRLREKKRWVIQATVRGSCTERRSKARSEELMDVG